VAVKVKTRSKKRKAPRRRRGQAVASKVHRRQARGPSLLERLLAALAACTGWVPDLVWRWWRRFLRWVRRGLEALAGLAGAPEAEAPRPRRVVRGAVA